MKYQILKGQNKQIAGSRKLPVKVFKIIALKSFEVLIKGSEKNGYIDKTVLVKKDDIGGYIQNESNLSQTDASWVFNTACVLENATLENSAVIEDAMVCDGAKVIDSIVSGWAKVLGVVRKSGLHNNSRVSKDSEVTDSHLYNHTKVDGGSKVQSSKMFHGSRVNKNSVLINCKLEDQSEVTDNAVCENCHYSGQTFIKGGRHFNETEKHEIQLGIESVADPNRILDF